MVTMPSPLQSPGQVLCLVQVDPLLVCNTVLELPTAHATVEVGEATAKSVASVGVDCSRHVFPPSLVCAMAPKSPTAKPSFRVEKLTPNRVLVVAGFCSCQVLPSAVWSTVPRRPRSNRLPSHEAYRKQRIGVVRVLRRPRRAAVAGVKDDTHE